MECEYCDKTPEQRQELENERRSKYGWIVEYVPGDPAAPNNINCHTHFLPQQIGHPDLQICLPMYPQTCAGWFHLVVGYIEKGQVFLPGIKYPGILETGFDLMFIEAKESGRDVLRLIFPDVENSYNDPVYAAQFTLTENHI